MISTQLPDEAYQLAAEYGLGEPVRVYQTNKRPYFKILGWSMAVTYLFLIIVVIVQTPFRLSSTTFFLYGLVIAIMVLLTLIFFIPLMLLRPTTVYICSSGFIVHHKTNYQTVRWKEIEWVLQGSDHCTVYLNDKRRVIMSRLIDQREMMAQEIELKARLIKHEEGRENLEQQFELMRSRQTGRQQEKQNISAEKRALIENETFEEASMLREEHRLGEILATLHAGFKGILRKEFINKPIYYALLFSFALMFIGQFFHFSFFPGGVFLASNSGLIIIILSLAAAFFMPRSFARYTRLHFYTEGFIFIESGSFEVVRWEQVDKVIYHKTMPILSPPFCHIYLTNGDTLAISGYLHKQNAARQIFNEHVVNKVQVG